MRWADIPVIHCSQKEIPQFKECKMLLIQFGSCSNGFFHQALLLEVYLLNPPVLQALMDRITALEETVQRNQINNEMLEKIKAKVQKEEGTQYMYTISPKCNNSE